MKLYPEGGLDQRDFFLYRGVFRVFKPRYQEQADQHQAHGQQERGCKSTVLVLERFHDVHKDHGCLAKQLDQTVRGALGGRVGNFSRVLHTDRVGAHQEESH